MKTNMLSFDSSVKRTILDIFDKTVDKNNYVIEKSYPNNRVQTPQGDELTLNDFVGISKGSLVFIKNDFLSLINLVDKLK